MTKKEVLTMLLIISLIYTFAFMFSAINSCYYETHKKHHYEEGHHHSENCLECNHVHTESCLKLNHFDNGYSKGLMSLTVSPLSAETLEAEIIKSDTDNSIKVVWATSDCTGTLNGASYTSGTWITKEGSYIFVLKDAEGNSKTYTFSITHLYESVTVAPTCSEKGYTRYTCKQCGGSYDANYVTATGHKYVETTVSTTCTESGGLLHTCTVCGYNYLSDIDYPSGHNYDSTVIRLATCTQTGQLHEVCEYCHDDVTTIVPATGHNYIIIEVTKVGKTTQRKLECTNCGGTYTENLGNQYERVGSYMELIFNTYRPYMILVFVGTAGVWSIFIGISYAIAQKNEEKEKARRMLVNYVIGLIAIFAILVACPYLIRGITALVT